MKSNIEKKLNELQEDDIYSLILFALFKLKDIPEYSALRELSYIMDKNSLFNFLNYFGGTTIKVPTINELKILLYSLLLYEFVNLEHIEFNEAVKKLNQKEFQLKEIKKVYFKLCKILSKYNFKRR